MSRDHEIAQSQLLQKFTQQFTRKSKNKQHETTDTTTPAVNLWESVGVPLASSRC